MFEIQIRKNIKTWEIYYVVVNKFLRNKDVRERFQKERIYLR